MSELYELPDGWEWKKLDDTCSKITDGAHKSPKTIEKGNPYITVRDLDWNGKIDFINCKFISDEDFQLLIDSSCMPFSGDVLFSKDGTVGKVSLVDDSIPFVVLSSLAILRPNSCLLSNYLEKYLKSPFFMEIAIKNKTGAAIKRIVLRTIKSIVIPLPPLKEQKRIVSKLDTIFEKIDKAIELHEKNIKEADAFMGSVLNEVFEELEERYQIFKVGDITDCIVPQRNKPKQFIGKIPWVTTDDLKLFKGILKSTKGLGLRSEEILESKSKIIPKNSVIMSCVGDLGIVALADNDIVVNQQLHTFQCKESLLNIYLMYALYVKKDFMYHIANITTVAYMNKTKCNSIPLPLPPLNVQHKVVKYLDKISQKIEKTKAIQKEKLQNLKDLKASILDQAFKGQL